MVKRKKKTTRKRTTKRKAVRRTKRTLKAPIVKRIRGKRYFLTKFAFTTKSGADRTVKVLRADRRIKGAAIVSKMEGAKKFYLIYIRV